MAHFKIRSVNGKRMSSFYCFLLLIKEIRLEIRLEIGWSMTDDNFLSSLSFIKRILLGIVW